MEEEQKKIYKCTSPRPDGGICGYETTDPNAYCPHDNVIISSGEVFFPPVKEKVCPYCKQVIPEQKKVIKRMATTDYAKPVEIEDQPKAKPARPIGEEMQKESDPGKVRGTVFK